MSHYNTTKEWIEALAQLCHDGHTSGFSNDFMVRELKATVQRIRPTLIHRATERHPDKPTLDALSYLDKMTNRVKS